MFVISCKIILFLFKTIFLQFHHNNKTINIILFVFKIFIHKNNSGRKINLIIKIKFTKTAIKNSYTVFEYESTFKTDRNMKKKKRKKT